MDWDFRDLSWEQRALIGIGVITLVVLLYAYNPFAPRPSGNVTNDIAPAIAPQPVPVNDQSSNNSTNSTPEGNFTISKEQAKLIAKESGYKTGDPRAGTIMINNQNVSVWIVPLYINDKMAKEVYVNSITGVIVGRKVFP